MAQMAVPWHERLSKTLAQLHWHFAVPWSIIATDWHSAMIDHKTRRKKSLPRTGYGGMAVAAVLCVLFFVGYQSQCCFDGGPSHSLVPWCRGGHGATGIRSGGTYNRQATRLSHPRYGLASSQ